MAVLLSKSGNFLPHLKQRFSARGIINLSSWSYCFSQKQPSLPENGRIPHAVMRNRPTLLSSRYFESVMADKLNSVNEERVHCYCVLDDDGQPVSCNFFRVDKDTAVKMYRGMVTLQTMDSALGIKATMVKAGRCLLTMGHTSTIISRLLQQSRKT